MSATTLPAAIPTSLEAAQKSDGFWAAAYKRLRKNKVASISAVFIILLALVAVFGPYLYPHDYATQDRSVITQGPSWNHPMGTDQLGRDIMARMIFGARISLTVGIVVQTVILLIGVPAGLCAGYFGGKIDMVLMRIVDILYALPSLLFVIVIMTFLRGTLSSSDLTGFWGVLGNFDRRTGGLIGVPITVKGKNSITFQDVLSGEVWVCSGQSNMQWPVAAAVDSDLAIKAALPFLRRKGDHVVATAVEHKSVLEPVGRLEPDDEDALHDLAVKLELRAVVVGDGAEILVV